METVLTLSDIHDLRRRQAAGEVLTDDELRKAVEALGESRMTAKPQQRKPKADVPTPSLFDLSGSEDDKE